MASLGLLTGCRAAAPPPPPPTPDEVRRVEAETDRLADALDDAAVALERGDRGPFAALLAPELEASRFPDGPGPGRIEHGWLTRHDWPRPGSPESSTAAEVAADFGRLLDRFAALDSASFEVVASREEGADRLTADLSMSLAGLDHEGRREWLRGTLAVAAHRDPDAGWRLNSLTARDLSSLVAERDLFADATEAAGVAAEDPSFAAAGADGSFWYPNGAAAADVDGDGLVDLFVTGPTVNHLYLNRGDGGFRDAAAEVGLDDVIAGKPELAPIFFDMDNDGDLDLFVTSVYQNALLENRRVPDGTLRFRDASAGLPQIPDVQGWSVAVGDVDRDGLPDLYVTSYFTPMKGPYPLTTVDDVAGSPNVLYLNRGGGRFEEAAAAWGVDDRRFGMAAQFADVDGDGDLDLYVANDFGGGNPLYVNVGGRFEDRAPVGGAVLDEESMGVSFADYDNDGDLDLHVTNMSSTAANRVLARYAGDGLADGEHLARQWTGNALLANRGDGTFEDVSAAAGPFPAEWAWGGGFLDVDNDGWEDLHTPNGFNSNRLPHDARGLVFGGVILAFQVEDPKERQKALDAPFIELGKRMGEQGASFAGWSHDRVYLNRGDGTFLDVSGVAGADSYPSDARASVYADFDDDGDPDVFVRATHGRAHFLFRNEVGQDSPWLRIALEGRASGRDAFGAVVRVTTPKLTLTKSKLGGNGYLAQGDPRLLFGLGGATRVDAIEVHWPSGKVDRFAGPFSPGSLRIVEGEGPPQPVVERAFRLGG